MDKEKSLVLCNFGLGKEKMKELKDFFTFPDTPPEKVKYFPETAGKKAGLSYIDDEFVLEQLDEKFTPAGWKLVIISKSNVDEAKALGKVVVEGYLAVYCGKELGWVEKFDCGEQDVELTTGAPSRIAGDPFKSAVSDLLKRCAYRWGVARDVYAGKFGKKVVETKPGQGVTHTPTELQANQIITFGQYKDKGKTFKQVLVEDRNYIEYLATGAGRNKEIALWLLKNNPIEAKSKPEKVITPGMVDLTEGEVIETSHPNEDEEKILANLQSKIDKINKIRELSLKIYGSEKTADIGVRGLSNTLFGSKEYEKYDLVSGNNKHLDELIDHLEKLQE